MSLVHTGDAFGGAAAILGGDHLVRVRIKTAKALVMGAHTREYLLDMFHPIVIEMFHIQQDFLEVITFVIFLNTQWKVKLKYKSEEFANFYAIILGNSSPL